MNKTICVKCGKEIKFNPLQQTKFPMVHIINYSYVDNTKVDLCDICKKEFITWVGKGELE